MAMRQTAVRLTGALCLSLAASIAAAQAPRPDADLCAVPPGAQPLLPARLMQGQGKTDMPVTTSSEEARRFFNQGVSQVHSFWFLESERSFLQAATLDPDMAMAYWGISTQRRGRPSAGVPAPARPAGRRPPRGWRRRDGAGGGQAQHQRRRARPDDPRARGDREGDVAARQGHAARAPLHRGRVGAPQPRVEDARPGPHRGPAQAGRGVPDDLEAKSILGLALLDGFEPVTKAPRKNTLEGLALLESVVRGTTTASARIIT
jgi:hypothetical protein